FEEDLADSRTRTGPRSKEHSGACSPSTEVIAPPSASVHYALFELPLIQPGKRTGAQSPFWLMRIVTRILLLRKGEHMSKLFSLSLGLLSLFALMHFAAAQPRIGGGDQFTCALGASGRAFCWGDNTSGQIGDGAGTQSPNSRVSVPVEMAGGFTQVAVGL